MSMIIHAHQSTMAWVSPHFDSCSMCQPYVGVIYATQNVFPRYFTGILCLSELLFHVDDAKTKVFPHARGQRTGRPHLSLLTSSTNLTLSSVSWFLCLDLQIGMANKSNVTDLLFLRTGPIPINVWNSEDVNWRVKISNVQTCSNGS